jgi:hypothetical protein
LSDEELYARALSEEPRPLRRGLGYLFASLALGLGVATLSWLAYGGYRLYQRSLGSPGALLAYGWAYLLVLGAFGLLGLLCWSIARRRLQPEPDPPPTPPGSKQAPLKT